MKKNKEIEVPDCKNCENLLKCLPFGDETFKNDEERICKMITVKIK